MAFKEAHETARYDFMGTGWEEVQIDVCTALALGPNHVETTIGEVLHALDQAGYVIARVQS